MDETIPVDLDDHPPLERFIGNAATCTSQTYLKMGIRLNALLREHMSTLKISQVCVATAMVYVHSFYSKVPVDSEHHPLVVLATCLWLACKVENVLRSVKQMVKVFFPEEPNFEGRAKQLCRYELALCQLTDWMLNVPHPYAKLGNFFQTLEGSVRKRLQEVTGVLLNTSYASPFYLVFGENQSRFIGVILRPAVHVLGTEGFQINQTEILEKYPLDPKELTDIEKNAIRCLREVILLTDPNYSEIADAIDTVYLSDDKPESKNCE
uniref:Cyclin-like domain-containing protein n=1 Tax=Paramoeba aestuarina TaxID=180227 RepID=A0A7S4KMM0_9EUKA|mmetsp:Transcript_21836/g.33937  ORF Transcript_21836/g.33937 Transcript_21836/m.33937 type:complete len:266 (+) Transcript_21836:31-828(+)